MDEIFNVITSPFISNVTLNAGLDLCLSALFKGNQGTPCQRAGVDQVLQEFGFTVQTLYNEYTGILILKCAKTNILISTYKPS